MRPRYQPTTSTVLALLREHRDGLRSVDMHRIAHERGIPVPYGSLRQTVCILYRDGMVVRECGGRYRMAKGDGA